MSPAYGTAALDTIGVLIVAARTALLFRVQGRRAVARATRRAMIAAPPAPAELEPYRPLIRRTHRAFRRARALWPANWTCLESALILHAALRLRGISSTVRLGVRRHGSLTEAHAWVEVGGYHLDDAGIADRFASFGRLPAAPSPQGSPA
jgi:hypothetical protein